MRQYPKWVKKGREDQIVVNNEAEEYQAGLDGYERHWNPEVNEKEKGTAKEILRVDPNEAEMAKDENEAGTKKRVRRSKEQIEADNKKGE